jgi:hypothetical protein
LAADFLATAFFFATFFLADFFTAGFFRATAFLRVDFLAVTFFLLTLLDFVAAFFLVEGLPLATFFREALAGLRFLLAVFFAGIFYSYRSEKNAQLYIGCADMEARISRFSRWEKCIRIGSSSASCRRAVDRPETGIVSGIQANLSSTRDNRFMPEFTLHYPEFSGMGVTPANAT